MLIKQNSNKVLNFSFSGKLSDPGDVDSVYVTVVNTPALFTYHRSSDIVHYIDLYDVLPTHGTMMQPSVKVAPLGNPLSDQVVIFEEKVSTASKSAFDSEKL